MAEPASPFIPPFPPLPSPGVPPQQPVIPEPPANPGANLDWGARPQHAGAMPIYPTSPYVPGFQPPLFPPTPNVNSRLPPTISAEYVGYPGAVPPPIPMGPPTPWSASIQPVPGAWPGMGPARPQGPFQGYQTPYPPHQGAWPTTPYTPYPGGPPGWGPPVTVQPPTPAAVATPGGYGLLTFDPMWPGHVPAWTGFGQPPAAYPQQNPVPEYLQAARSRAQIGDRLDPFTAGTGYGPVLEPFETQLVEVQPGINPLLEPLADTADRPHLKWNMLFRSNDCCLSTDESHVSWSKGRDAPATFPRVTQMTIISERFPWSVTVNATNPAIGVTCGDVIDQLAADFYRLTSKSDYEALDQKRQTEVAQVYRHNRSREPGVPGGTLKEGIRRLDYLGKDIIFGGIGRDNDLVFKLLKTLPPCTYVLKCLKQYALTAQEAMEHEKRRRENEEKEREERRKREEEERRRARQPTVEDDDDDD